MKHFPNAIRNPIYWLLAIVLVIALLVFRDYGFAWDEPLFYQYADDLGYAYTPANWLGGHFDLTQSYGPSGDDHKTRGPGYLLLARTPVGLLKKLGADTASAWHLVNFTTYLLGVYFIFRLCKIFTGNWAALSATALFVFQPLLWGHAFINPKDIPFLVFLTGTIWLGFRMVDLLEHSQGEKLIVGARRILLPAVFLGVASSNRVLGPLGGLLVITFFLTRKPTLRSIHWIAWYILLSSLIMLATWPYLWEDPLRFLGVFQLMSDNPTVLPVLFADTIYRAYELPRRYLPFFLVSTLTEVVWPLFLLGLSITAWKLRTEWRKFSMALLLLTWIGLPFLYAVVLRPPLYDGMRHYLFILPPIFIIAAIGLDYIFLRSRSKWVALGLAFLLVAPGLVGIVRLHPYQYTYYNLLVGGTGGAFRHYETDYWLTCYKEAVEQFNQNVRGQVKLFVHREAAVAKPYAASNVDVVEQRGAARTMQQGNFLLINTRTNEDIRTSREAPIVLTIGRAGATFCVVKVIP